MSDPRRDKRWRREHRAKPAADRERAYATAPMDFASVTEPQFQTAGAAGDLFLGELYT